jgi:Tol biopolymer transport system component
MCAFGSSKPEPFAIYPEIPLPSGSLIFTVNGRNLFKLDDDQLTDKPVIELYSNLGHSPALSPDASRTVFVWSQRLLQEPLDSSASLYYPPGLYLLNLTKDQPPKLLWRAHDGPGETDDPSPFSPHWLPDGERVVFLLGNSNHQDVYMLDLETQTLKQVFKCEDYCHFVISAPVSRRLLFTSLDRSDAQQPTGTISILEEDHTARVLIEDKGVDYVTKPSWSPDESQIAFTTQTSEQGYRNVFLINTDGTGLSQLTDDEAYYYSPVWSPDGKILAFAQKTYTGERVASRIILMDLQTKELQTLLTSSTQLDDLQWLNKP